MIEATAMPKEKPDLKKIIGNNPLVKDSEEEMEKEEKYQRISVIMDLAHAAHKKYCEDGMSWDKMVDALVGAISKLKGKEDQLSEKDD